MRSVVAESRCKGCGALVQGMWSLVTRDLECCCKDSGVLLRGGQYTRRPAGNRCTKNQKNPYASAYTYIFGLDNAHAWKVDACQMYIHLCIYICTCIYTYMYMYM